MVRWQAGRKHRLVHLGSFKTLEEAETRKRVAELFIAQGRYPDLDTFRPQTKRKVKPRRPLIPRKLRFDVLERDRFTCQYCGRQAPFVEIHVDHVFPLARGGKTTLDNLKTACVDCNQGKRARVLEFIPGEQAS